MSYPILLAVLAGVSTSMVFQIFALAGIGKVFYCGGKSQLICQRGIGDLLIAALAGVCAHPWAQLACAVLALTFGLGGLLRMAIAPDRPCNCFGVLSHHLEPVAHPLRIGLLMFGGLACASLLGLDRVQLDSAAFFLAAAWTLKLGLLGQVFWLTKIVVARNALAQSQLESAPKEVDLSDAVLVGHLAGETTVDIGTILSQAPIAAVLVAAPGCSACTTIVPQVAALAAAGRLPLPLYLLSTGPYPVADGATLLVDPQGRFQAKLGISAMPMLVVLRRESPLVVGRLVVGEDEIRSAFFDLMV
jgi:hypothetical protein